MGLFYAWNRASRRFDQWRSSVKARLLELRGQLSRRYEAEFGVKLEPQIGMVAEGGGHPAWHA
jgi:hypothetical protein